MINGKMTRRAFLGLTAMAGLSACGGGASSSDGGADAAATNTTTETAAAAGGDVKITMVTDTGGVNDQSFNQISWEGMQRLRDEDGWEISYIESKQEADFTTNLDKAVDDDSTIVWGIGFAMSDAINEAAQTNPDVKFCALESENTSGASNLTGVAFRQQEPSFVVGYIAARMSKKGKVGFVGGIESETIESFKNGYFGGVEYANKEQGLSVTYEGQYAESFGDAAKGKSIAQKMIQGGADVLFHAAGGTGAGMIEACAEAGVWAIGVDMDQSHLAPQSVITSAIKRCDNAIVEVSKQIVDGTLKGGDNIVLGAADDAVGISETHDLIPDDIYQDALTLLDKIKATEITVPNNASELESFIKGLK